MNKIIILFLLASLASCNAQKNDFIKEVEQFQYKLNVQYSDVDDSPLTPKDMKSFKSLVFFEINKNFKVIADFKETPDTDIFEMPTTTNRKPLYRKYGIATFEIQGEKLQLNLYQNQQFISSVEYGDSLFLPYTDLTNGISTYGGGRYIDVKIPPADATTIVIDFNQSYNPYCAYNMNYSCPVVPSENNLELKIKAGVKRLLNSSHKRNF